MATILHFRSEVSPPQPDEPLTSLPFYIDEYGTKIHPDTRPAPGFGENVLPFIGVERAQVVSAIDRARGVGRTTVAMITHEVTYQASMAILLAEETAVHSIRLFLRR